MPVTDFGGRGFTTGTLQWFIQGKTRVGSGNCRGAMSFVYSMTLQSIM
jgi:hypothetical protein